MFQLSDGVPARSIEWIKPNYPGMPFLSDFTIKKGRYTFLHVYACII